MEDVFNEILNDSTYEIIGKIGSGGGGIIYKAWHKRLKKYVIIKELIKGNEKDIETQRNEVEALKNVKSPYLPQVLDFIVENGRIYTVIEFIEGESFDKLLERGVNFTQVEVIKWYGQLASALEVLHKEDICHRDIKPANIMLMPSGNICLIDFNASLVKGNSINMVSRSLGYASPEQYEIYEKFRNERTSPINLSNSTSIKSEAKDNLMNTEILETEYIKESELLTEILEDNIFTTVLNFNKTETEILTENEITENKTYNINHIDWKLSDIYSLGATMYHLLTNVAPSKRAIEIVPVSELGKYSEGLVYIIEHSMFMDPLGRLSSVEKLYSAIKNIHNHDSRWVNLKRKKLIIYVASLIAIIVFSALALYGRNVIAQEKEEEYYKHIYNIQNGIDVEKSYGTALMLYWDRIDPYIVKATYLWNSGEIEICKKYIEENLGELAKFQDMDKYSENLANIFYILGNCYYYDEKPNYMIAREHFEKAINIVENNPDYYRDYAISLARTNGIDKAVEILARAEEIGLTNNSINLLMGEINYKKNEYEEAISNFREVINNTEEDYIRYRAYHSSDEIFKILGENEKSIELLIEAIDKVPLNYVNEMKERLADSYIKNGDYSNAIEIFIELSENGNKKFNILQNLVVLYQNNDDFNNAKDILEEMEDLFPNDYRVPMLNAYIEADLQSTIANEKRDYSKVKKYYDTAKVLYDSNLKVGESDTQMQQLDLLIEQLKSNNWIK